MIQQPRQKQQIINTHQVQQTYRGQSSNSRPTNTGQRKIRNTGNLVISETIDLSSPPSIPVLPSVVNPKHTKVKVHI